MKRLHVLSFGYAHRYEPDYQLEKTLTGVFPKWSRTFSEFSELRESGKSFKHELG